MLVSHFITCLVQFRSPSKEASSFGRLSVFPCFDNCRMRSIDSLTMIYEVFAKPLSMFFFSFKLDIFVPISFD